MRPIISLLSIAALVFIGADRARAAEVVSTASGLIRVTAGHETPLAQGAFPWVLLASESLCKEAVATVSADAASEAPKFSDVAKVKFGSGASGAISITVESYKERVPADKLLAALVEVLNKRVHELAVNEYEADARQLADENKRFERLKEDLNKEHEALLTLAAIHKVEIDSALAAQKRVRIETELQSLDVQLHGLKARQAVIEHQIAQLANVVASAAANDRVLKELEKSVAFRKEIVGTLRAKFATGTVVTQEQVLDAEDQHAQAEAEVAKFRAHAAEQAGGRRIAELKTRLDDTAIELAEIEVKSKVLQEQFEQARNSSGQVMIKRIEVELLEREYRDRAENLSKLRAQMRQLVTPSVTLIPLD
ncbi:MAG: hypothetical protein WD063_03865 [Pirellulales bacterium]